MTDDERHDLFTKLVDRHHRQLYAYIFAVVKNRDDAEDVFQSVCLVLWRKFDTFRLNTHFFAWARQTAKLVLLSFLRHKEKLPTHADEELLDNLADTSAEFPLDDPDFSVDALRRCREKLTAGDEELLDLRYIDDLTIAEIAERLERLPPNVSRSLHRIRNALLECIRREIARRKHPKGNEEPERTDGDDNIEGEAGAEGGSDA